MTLITHFAATVSGTSIRSESPDLAHLGGWQNKMADVVKNMGFRVRPVTGQNDLLKLSSFLSRDI